MKIIKPGKEVYNYTIEEFKTIECETCGCVFEYTNQDLTRRGSIFMNDIDYTIDCPHCGERYIDLEFKEG
jgi:DNA-directed RNA polymerase subunit RPC12/RpoP